MEDPYENMLAELNKIDSDNNYQGAAKHPEQAVKPVKGVATTKAKTPRKTDMSYDNNLLNPVTLARYKAPIAENDNGVLTPPIPTTMTVIGSCTNVALDEERDIDLITPSAEIVLVKSNFGNHIHDSYTEPVSIKKSNRGRKKLTRRAKKPRRRQGNGECFNSQITFRVRVCKADGSNEICEFKVFRDGTMQLFGMTPDRIATVTKAVRIVVAELNRVRVAGRPEIELVGLYPNMKNYKFYLRMKPKQKIYLALLKDLFKVEQLRHNGEYEKYSTTVVCNCGSRDCAVCNDQRVANTHTFNMAFEAPEHPHIIDIKYTFSRSCLSIRFATPYPNNPNKTLLLKIYPGGPIDRDYDKKNPTAELQWGGRMNIQGGRDEDTTRSVFNYVNSLLGFYHEDVVGYEGEGIDDEYEYVIEDPFDDNIVLVDCDRWGCGLSLVDASQF